MNSCPTFVHGGNDPQNMEWTMERASLIATALRADEYHAPHTPRVMDRGVMLMHRTGSLNTIWFNLLHDPRDDGSDVPGLCQEAARAIEPASLRFDGFDARPHAIPVLASMIDAGMTPDGPRWRIIVRMPTTWSAAATSTKPHSHAVTGKDVPIDPGLCRRMPQAARIVTTKPHARETEAWFLMPEYASFEHDALPNPIETLRALRSMDGSGR